MVFPRRKPLAGKAPGAKKPWLRGWVEAFLVAAVIAVFVRSFVIQAFGIPTGSMEDTLLVGDHIFISKFEYGIRIPYVQGRFFALREPRRGDIVVFEYPEDRDLPLWKKRDFIKRVVGLPGDVVEVRDRQVLVNGTPFHLPQAVHKDPKPSTGVRDNMPPVTVPAGEYFMMGDNRDFSIDSRFWGTAKLSEFKGPVLFRYWSWDSEARRVRWERIGRRVE